MLEIGMSRTRTSSRWFSSKVLSSTASGSAYSPARISAYARATRAGVSRSPSRSGSSPTARSSSRTAASARGRSSSGIARPSARATAWTPRGHLPVAVGRAQVRPPSSTERVPDGGVSVPSSASGVRPLPGHCCVGVGACDFQPGGGHDCPDGVVAGRQSGGAP